MNLVLTPLFIFLSFITGWTCCLTTPVQASIGARIIQIQSFDSLPDRKSTWGIKLPFFSHHDELQPNIEHYNPVKQEIKIFREFKERFDPKNKYTDKEFADINLTFDSDEIKFDYFQKWNDFQAHLARVFFGVSSNDNKTYNTYKKYTQKNISQQKIRLTFDNNLVASLSYPDFEKLLGIALLSTLSKQERQNVKYVSGQYMKKLDYLIYSVTYTFGLAMTTLQNINDPHLTGDARLFMYIVLPFIYGGLGLTTFIGSLGMAATAALMFQESVNDTKRFLKENGFTKNLFRHLDVTPKGMHFAKLKINNQPKENFNRLLSIIKQQLWNQSCVHPYYETFSCDALEYPVFPFSLSGTVIDEEGIHPELMEIFERVGKILNLVRVAANRKDFATLLKQEGLPYEWTNQIFNLGKRARFEEE